MATNTATTPAARNTAVATPKASATPKVSTQGIDQEVIKASKPEVMVNYKINPKATLPEIEARISDIINKGASLRKVAHETACELMIHYSEHGDYTGFARVYQKLTDAIGGKTEDGVRTPAAMSRSMARALRDWVVANSSLRWNDDKSEFYHNKRDKRIPSGKPGFFDNNAMNPGSEFFNFERDPQAPKALTAAEILQIIANGIQRVVKLKLEAENGKTVEIGGKERTFKPKHEIDSKLLTDLVEFATAHGLDVDMTEGKVTPKEAAN